MNNRHRDLDFVGWSWPTCCQERPGSPSHLPVLIPCPAHRPLLLLLPIHHPLLKVNIGDDMRVACLEMRARDAELGTASMDTFTPVVLELLSRECVLSLLFFFTRPSFFSLFITFFPRSSSGRLATRRAGLPEL